VDVVLYRKPEVVLNLCEISSFGLIVACVEWTGCSVVMHIICICCDEYAYFDDDDEIEILSEQKRMEDMVILQRGDMMMRFYPN